MSQKVNECIPTMEPGDRFTGFCEAAVTGKRLVKVSDPKKVASQALSSTTDGGNIVVSPCGAGEAAIAVAEYDAAINTLVPCLRGTKHVPITSGAAVTAGDVVMSDATGRVVPFALGNTPAEGAALPVKYAVGIALTSTGAAGNDVIVALNL